MSLFGCIEAGGTKFVLGLADADGAFLAAERVPTTTPAETLAAVDRFFDAAPAPIAAIGIASFGPVGVDRGRADWGQILDTPKPGWSGIDLAGPLAVRHACPVGFDTDVNGAILAEHRWGAAQGCSVATYVTVGTGIGGGVVIDGRAVHGLRHPEMGHIRLKRHEADRDFAGACPFHGDCLEGLASGPAISARWGTSLSHLASDHVAHEVVAFYLAQLVIAQQALLSPERIVLGGGVMATPGLIDRIRATAANLANGYFGVDDYAALIAPPALGDEAGLRGALALAIDAQQGAGR